MSVAALRFGMDFGSTGCRLAYIGAGDAPVPVSLPPGWRDPDSWIRCVSRRGEAPGVAFETLKARLEGNFDDAASAGELQRLFNQVRTACELQPGNATCPLAISLPSTYPSTRREVLRNAALAAGFSPVHIVFDTLAAAVEYIAGNPTSRNLLVYSCGYTGYEVGLIRSAKGRYRSLAQGGSRMGGGASFDAFVVASIRQFLAERNWWPGDEALDQHAWLAVRDAAQRIKEGFSTSAVIELAVTGWAGVECQCSFQRSDFECLLAPLAVASLDFAQSALEEANLSLADVEQLLFAGGSLRIPLLRRLAAERFGRAASLGGDYQIAFGAARYAAQLADGEDGPPWEVATPEPASFHVRPLPAASANGAGPRVVLRLPEGAGSGRRDPLLRARALWSGLRQETQAAESEGRRAEVAALFQEIHEDLSAFRNSTAALEAVAAFPRMKSEAERSLRRAEEHLQAGRYFEAVGYSHRSYAVDPESPRVLEQMIDIHCRAAAALGAPDQYSEAIAWLTCALNHDRTNRQVHQAIADRRFLHARHSADRGERDTALCTLDECLLFDPDHAEALRLRSILSKPDD